MDTSGPYKVGVKQIRITERRLQASVYYPVDKDTKGVPALWWPDAQKTLAGMKSVFSQMFNLPVFPDFLVTPNLLVEIPAF